MNNLEIQLPVPTNSKFDFEFQELCTEMQVYYGRKIWALPHRAGFTEQRIRQAFEIAKKRNNFSYGYLIGIIKRLP